MPAMEETVKITLAGTPYYYFAQRLSELVAKEAAAFGSKGQAWGWGATWQRARLHLMAELSCNWPGDLLEIGCLNGVTTEILQRVALKNNRRVIAVDPFEPGAQECQESTFDIFKKKTAPLKDVLDFIRLKSQDREAIDYIKSRDICFAYVDGLHTPWALRIDLQTVNHCAGAIAVDDLLWSAKVRAEFYMAAARLSRDIFHPPHCREGYLIRRKETEQDTDFYFSGVPREAIDRFITLLYLASPPHLQ